MPTTDQKLNALAHGHIDGRMAYKIMYYSELNPEQKLAYLMEQLIVVGKEKLALMEVVLLQAKEVVVWKDTPEGVAWREEKAKKRLTTQVQPVPELATGEQHEPT